MMQPEVIALYVLLSTLAAYVITDRTSRDFGGDTRARFVAFMYPFWILLWPIVPIGIALILVYLAICAVCVLPWRLWRSILG